MALYFIGYEKCSTCKKAENFLKQQQLEYQKRDIKTEHPSQEEIKKWSSLGNLPLKKFFNTSGNVYKSLNLKESLPSCTEQQQLELLESNGMLVKRPILVTPKTVLIGFRLADWEKALKDGLI